MKLQRLSSNAAVEHGEELGRGGEGFVAPLMSESAFVAKVYFAAPEARKSAKLRVLSRHATAELQAVAAWPVDVLLDEAGVTRGVLMPRLEHFEELHELYTPRSRRRAFPEADFRFIVTVALNLARAIEVMHTQGHVIGDVNHGNAVVMPDGGVRLIDCDSFQLRDGDTLYTCDVGVPLFTPPELQGSVYRGLERTADHDNFGLAVLLFHLLFLGRHPFAGRSAIPDMTIERAIAERRFAYGANAAARDMAQPPGTLALDTFGAEIAALFEQAFTADAGNARPSASQWSASLGELQRQLVVCAASPEHQHPPDRACCWCEVESRAARIWFGGPLRSHKVVNLEQLELLWSKVERTPPPDLKHPPPVPYLLQGWFKVQEQRGSLRWLVACTAAIGIGMNLEGLSLQDALSLTGWMGGAAVFLVLLIEWWTRDMESETLSANVRWLTTRVEAFAPRNHLHARAELRHVRARLLAIASRPESAMAEVLERHTETSRQKHLASIPLTAAKSAELGPEDLQRLERLGLRNAADLLSRPGDLHHAVRYWQVHELKQWVQNRASEFVLDDRFPVPADPEWADRELRTVTADLLKSLVDGPALLLESGRQDRAAFDALHDKALRRLVARELP